MERFYTKAFSALEEARQLDSDSAASSFSSSAAVGKAMSAYKEAILLFKQVIQEESNEDKKVLIQKNVSSLSLRVEELEGLQLDFLFREQGVLVDVASLPLAPPANDGVSLNLPLPPSTPLVMATPPSSSSHDPREHADNLLREALALDEKGTFEDRDRVIDQYASISEMYIMYLKSETGSIIDEGEKISIRSKVSKILDRIAQLKEVSVSPPSPTKPTTVMIPTMAAISGHKDDRAPLDAMELQVLKASSHLNGKIYQPWLDGEEEVEQFRYEQAWCDPDGLPYLSLKHLDVGAVWKRPREFLAEQGFTGHPRMAENISPLNIVQDMVGDCSFVCSLCIAAEVQQRFNKRLITSIIYPQNSKGIPVYNPSGKYLVKLFFNGVTRKIMVDDRLPCHPRNHRLLCATSTTFDLYVAIIEKAYMKLHGGYNFPGSNSGIDLYCLTGWIPEKVYFDEEGDHSQTSDRAWQRLLSAHKYGDCLVTIATFSEMTDADETLTGLVRGHAYAVLDIKQAGRLRMLKVKNPWSHRPWRGKFSNVDKGSWTGGLKAALGIKSQADFDAMERDGVFWIEFMDAKRFFKRFYLNWNPNLFSYRFSMHDTWPVKQGPKNDRYFMGSNPQFSFKLDYGAGVGATSGQVVSVWILLSKHMNSSSTKKFKTFQGSESLQESEDDEEDYLTCHVFSNTDGKRVYAPEKRFVSGLYTNDPHNLIRFDVDPAILNMDSGTVAYTFVLSQLSKSRDISYTITVLSTRPFLLNRTPGLPSNQIPIQDAWKEGISSGGSLSHEFFNINPQYRLTVYKNPTEVHFQMFYPADIQGSISVFSNSTMIPVGATRVEDVGKGVKIIPDRTDVAAEDDEVMSSGPYRTGYCHCSGVLPVGTYNVILSNYQPSMVGGLRGVCASGSKNVSLEAIPHEGAGYHGIKLQGEWNIGNGTAAGCNNHGNYLKNPQWRIDIPVTSKTSNNGYKGAIFFGARLRILNSTPVPMNISVYLITGEPIEGSVLPVSNAKKGPKKALLSSTNGIYTNLNCGVKIPISLLERNELARVVSLAIIPSTFDPLEASFNIDIYSNVHEQSMVISRIK